MHRPIVIATFVALAGCSVKVAEAPVKSPEPEQKVEVPLPEEPTVKATDNPVEATVLVTTKWGHGTGVTIRETGWVLTNHHVIALGKTEDYGLEAKVTIPKVNEDGSVEAGEQYKATVFKIDDKRDLALLKIEDAGETKFPIVKVAQSDPKPGSKVTAIGNAGVGFGWAVKKCSVNAVGSLEGLASSVFRKQQETTGVSEELRKEQQERFSKEAKEKGKQIQTDCKILPGDSGGPLIDDGTGEVVGINVAIRTARAGFSMLGSLAFHIHVAEVRDFVAKIPETAPLFLPDPWDVKGHGAFADWNEDGEIDTLRFDGVCGGLRCFSTLTDLDQSTFRKRKQIPPVKEVQEKRWFNAELAVVKMGRMPRDPSRLRLPVSDLLVYVNNDGKKGWEQLVVFDGETYKTRGYKVTKAGAERDTGLDNYALPDIAKLFKAKKLQAKASLVAAAVNGQRAGTSDPYKGRVLEASFKDSSGDGVLDTIEARTRLDRRVLVDLDQAEFDKKHKNVMKLVEKRVEKNPDKSGKEAVIAQRQLVKRLRKGRLKGDFLAVLGSPVRVFYDTDNDGKYDLMLEGESLSVGVALNASAIAADGGRTRVKEHVGRRLLRPGLIKDPKLAARLDEVLAKTFPGETRAAPSDGKTSFPLLDPKRVRYASEVPGTNKRAVVVVDPQGLSVLGDLDKSSFKGKNAKRSATDVVRDGKLDAEFQLRTRGGVMWAFYDANNDGRFEKIFVSEVGLTRIATAFSVDRKGRVKVDASQAGKPMLQADLFKSKKARKAFKDLEAKAFKIR